jgi:hypothetical protein
MARTSNPEKTGTGVMSRRDAIVGALALTAGTLLAQAPEVAHAANGDAVQAGDLNAGLSPTFLIHTDNGTILSPENSWALLAGSYSGVEYGVEGRVFAHSTGVGTGVHGAAETVGQTGVLAENTAAGGTALKVSGQAFFSRAGRSAISKGKTSVTVGGTANIATGALILVTLQGSAGSGVYLRYAKRLNSQQFQVVLNKAATSKVTCAWMIVNG